MGQAENFLALLAPIACATSGDLIGQRVGVLNLAIEGNMLLGCLSCWLLVINGVPIAVAFGLTAVLGVVVGLAHCILIDMLRCSQHASGLGLGFLTGGLALTIFRLLDPATKGTHVASSGWQHVALAWTAVSCFVLLAMLRWAEARHRLGIAWVSVGEDMRASELLGISPYRVRVLACSSGNALVLIGGGLISVFVTRAFSVGLVSGRGWVCLCLVILARWRPLLVIPMCTLYAGLELLQLNLQAAGSALPHEALLALPYIGCIMVVVSMARARRTPKMLGIPYDRTEDAA